MSNDKYQLHKLRTGRKVLASGSTEKTLRAGKLHRVGIPRGLFQRPAS